MQQYIYIFKGDDTNWNGEQFLTVNITSQTADLSNMTAKFILGSYEKTYPLTTGSFDIDLTAATTGSYAYGPICGTIQVIDEEKRIKTVANRIPFYITDQVIAEQVQTLDIAMPEGSEISLSLEVGKAAQITVDEELSTTSPNPVQNKVITLALEGKQDNLTAAQLNAANSGVTSSTVAQVGQNALAISDVEGKIPTQASAENQLADKNFVNSSINAVAAYYITSDVAGDPFATVAALDAGPYFSQGSLREPTRNDYALVTSDENHDGKTSRYLYDGSQWVWQYDLNNTTFTAAQVAAINSGVTSAKVAQIDTNANNITALQTASANNYTKTNLTAGTNISKTPSQADPNVFEVNNTQDISGLTTDVTDLKANALKNTATGTNALTILGTPTNYTGTINIGYANNTAWSQGTIALGNSIINYGNSDVTIGNSASGSGTGVTIGAGAKSNVSSCVTIGINARSGATSGIKIAIGSYAYANQLKSIAIGGGSSTADAAQANANEAIQLGTGSNTTAKTLQVYSYQLLDGNTGKIPAERLPDVFANIQKAANFNVVGAISIDYDWVASNFSAARYLIGPNNPTGTITSAQFDLKIKTPSSLSGDNFRCMLGQSAHNFYTPQIDFIGSAFHFRVSTDGTSWADLVVDGEFNANTDYYIRCVFDGTKLQAFKSANGVDYTQIGSDLPCSSMYWVEQMLIGLDTDAGGVRTGAWTGSIYLEDLSIKINGQDYWKAVNFMNSNLTLYPGYDATKTQVLKNVNGVLTWVEEA